MASPKTLEMRAWREQTEKYLKRGRAWVVAVNPSTRNARRTAHKTQSPITKGNGLLPELK